VELVETMIGKWFDICIYDNNIHIARLTGKNKEYIERHIPHLARLLAHDLGKLAHESDVMVVCNKEKQFHEVLKDVNGKVILDMIRVPQHLRESNSYIGINW